MKQFRLLLKTVVFAALALSMSLQANISPLAFNGIFKCFKPGYEMYAPHLGCVAIQTGLVNALRFYTTIPGGHAADGRRLWIKDKAPKKDPVSALTFLLFPSPAGNLTAMTNHSQNIGQSLTVTDVAQLLNFCKNVRQVQKSVKENNVIFNTNSSLQKYRAKKQNNEPITQAFYRQKRQNLTNYLSAFDKYFSHNYFSEFTKSFIIKKPQEQCTQLILLLCKIIEKEERDFEKFYPCYQAEQLLNAFFCLKFGKDDIPELLKNLDISIVDHEQLLEAGLINKTDIDGVNQKNVDSITLDDLWAIQNRDLIDQVIPYPRGCKPVNNGLASAYNREHNELVVTQNFADCTETTIRHLCNLVLFHKDGSFKVENALNQLSNSPIKNLLHNLEDFYELQSPDKANSGERSIRDAWSKVVGDLGNPVRYCKKSVRTNTYNDTEVDSGIINIIRVLNIIFNLGLDPEPVYENDQNFAKEVTKWAHSSLQKLFKTITPEKNADIQISEVRAFQAFGNYEYDCSGTIKVIVNQDFKFTMSVGSGHAQFDTIDILTQEQAPINEHILNQVIKKFQNAFSGKTTESIFLLDNRTKNQVITPAYTLFKNGLRDSTQIIDTLEILLEMTKQNEISLTRSAQILKNLLHKFLWQDMEMTLRIQPTLKKMTNFALQRKNQGIKNALQDEVKLVQYDLFSQDFNNNMDDLLDFFSEATNIFCSEQSNTTSFSLLRNHQSIKTIDLSSSAIKELNISGDTCPNLESLYLYETKNLNNLNLSGSLQKLKTINLSESAISELKISADICPSLEILYLRVIEQLKSIKLSGILQNLKSIDLSFSGITQLGISGDTCPSIEKVDLYATKKLKSLKLSGALQKLNNLYLSDSAISELEISGDCPNLEILNLCYTTQLRSFKLSGCFQNLKFIELSKLMIKKIEVAQGCCPNLQSTDPRIKIIDHKRKDRDEEIDDQKPDAKKQCLNDIREN